MKVLVVFYSTYGHIFKMAEEIAEGAKNVAGAKVEIRRVPETLPQEVLEKMGALEAQKTFSHIPVCTVEELARADAVIFGTPTRFGNMCGQMRQFLDATGSLWAEGALVGKVGSVFASSATQHPAVDALAMHPLGPRIAASAGEGFGRNKKPQGFVGLEVRFRWEKRGYARTLRPRPGKRQ